MTPSQVHIIVNVSGGLVQGVTGRGLTRRPIVVHIRDFDNGREAAPEDVSGRDSDGAPYQEWEVQLQKRKPSKTRKRR